MKRRTFLFTAASVISAATSRLMLADQTAPADPWSPGELMEPATLVKRIEGVSDQKILSVAFPFLYRQRHIPGAQFIGPASKPEGITALKSAVAKLPKNTSIVIYCGCCPMAHCPNIRPAYSTLKDLGFTDVHVLNLPTNFHTDWTAKGYPVSRPEVISHKLSGTTQRRTRFPPVAAVPFAGLESPPEASKTTSPTLAAFRASALLRHPEQPRASELLRSQRLQRTAAAFLQ